MKDRTEPCELTVLCLIEDGNRILLQDRRKNDGWNGLVLPGGHVEKGESFVEACKREVREETGLYIEHPKLCALKQFPGEYGRYIVVLYKTDTFSGTLQDSEEGPNMWFERDALPEERLVCDFHKMLRMFDEEDLSEFQYVETDHGLEAILR